MKRKISARLLCIILVALMLVPANLAFAQTQETQRGDFEPIQARYTGINSISANISISSAGVATCKATANIKSGYTADMTMSLKGVSAGLIKAWNTSGTGYLYLSETWPVTKGDTYYVSVYVAVYDSLGHFVEGATAVSNYVSY